MVTKIDKRCAEILRGRLDIPFAYNITDEEVLAAFDGGLNMFVARLQVCKEEFCKAMRTQLWRM